MRKPLSSEEQIIAILAAQERGMATETGHVGMLANGHCRDEGLLAGNPVMMLDMD